MAISDIRSLSQVDTSEPFELQVARGQIPGHSVIHVFGHNPDVDNNADAQPAEKYRQLKKHTEDAGMKVTEKAGKIVVARTRGSK